MRAVAIDFETANEQRASACSIGLAWIEDGRVTDRETYLIRPPEMRFAPVNIRIHGITPDMVKDAPEFPDVLASLRERIDGCDMVLAHNAGFDMSVVRASCDAYALSYPEFDYLCTVKVAQKVWSDLGSARLNVLGVQRLFGLFGPARSSAAQQQRPQRLLRCLSPRARDAPFHGWKTGCIFGAAHTFFA